MENRDRDKVSRNNASSTDAGKVNRQTSNIGNLKDDSSSEFGQSIGRSENLNEPNSRQSGSVGESGMRGSTGTGRSGSTGMGSGSKSNLGENIDSGRSGRSGSGWSEGEH